MSEKRKGSKPDNLHEGHRERMRKRFYDHGFAGWQKHEVLEFMLYNIFTRQDTNELAHKLLKCSGNSLRQLFINSEHSTLEVIDGVGKQTIEYLRTLRRFADYYHSSILSEQSIQLTRDNFREVVGYFGFEESYEDVIMICLDRYMRIKYVARVTESNSEVCAEISMARVMRIAAETDAANVVFVHNHPSGSPKPSFADIRLTARLEQVLNSMEVFLVDHYVVSGSQIESIKMLEYLQKYEDAELKD